MEIFLEIAILSYNRTEELRRTLDSFVGIHRDDVRICVYEDCSPNQNLIRDICLKYAEKCSINVEFKTSQVNLGYDKNLIRTLSSRAHYVLLLSDDDFIQPELLDEYLTFLKDRQPDVVISPFYKRGKLYRSGGHYSAKYSVDVLYDSVLFSGLAFKTSAISLTSDEIFFLSKSIYCQLYLVGKHWSRNCCYFDSALIIAGEDGENYFGLSDVSRDMDKLRDRKTLMSNLYYQENLQRVAFKCLNNFYPKLTSRFVSNYSKRLVSHFLRVRLNSGVISYLKSVLEMTSLKLKYHNKYVFFILIAVFIPQFLLRPIYDFLIGKFRVSGG